MSIIIYVIIIAVALASYLTRKLTFTAAVVAIMIAVFIFGGSGYTGLEMLGAFFILGVMATGWHKHDKEAFKPVADQGNRRDAWQVLANGGIAAGFGLLSYIPAFAAYRQVFCLMIAGSIASATADTLSSELGMVYGGRFYHITSFKPGKKGLDGVISTEGTIIGVIGSAVIALIYCATFGFSANFLIIIIAGITGNYVDSLLGATLERRHLLNNNMVNGFNTLTGALVAFAISRLIN